MNKNFYQEPITKYVDLQFFLGKIYLKLILKLSKYCSIKILYMYLAQFYEIRASHVKFIALAKIITCERARAK